MSLLTRFIIALGLTLLSLTTVTAEGGEWSATAGDQHQTR
jgi:hypothetical protein